ncbi:hypothetical protein [Clavibacter sp. km1a]|uniref:hypothetical protein n=1 Tax=Clavibacter sp. km1a TaxID=3459136 RepID=UPI004042C3FA
MVVPLVVAFLGARALVDASLGEDVLAPAHLTAQLVVGAVGGAILALVLHRARERTGPHPDGLVVTEALEDGVLPEDADTEAWTGALLRRRASAESETGPLLTVLAILMLLAGVAWGVLGGPGALWPFLALFAAVLVGQRVTRATRLARIDALLMPLLDAEGDARRDRDDPGSD